jgi:type 1 glutamine amidotransferase
MRDAAPGPLRTFSPMNTTIRRTLLTILMSGAAAFAAEPKQVIVCTVTTGFRHSSIPYAEKTLQRLGDESKAFTIVDFARQPEVQIPQKPGKPGDPKPDADDKAKAKYDKELAKYHEEIAKWTPEMDAKAKAAQADFDAQLKSSLAKLSPENLRAKKIDGVIFANTTGDLPLPDKEGFIKWIDDGHAFVGMHAASDTFHGFPGYLDMLQGEFAGHEAQVPADLIAADTQHPANAGIGEKWNVAQEEMYLIKNHDRAKVHTLWFMKHHPNKPEQAGYFPVSWCRKAGIGRVFYTSLGHREDLWDDSANLKDRKNSVEISKQFQAHILGGIKWALGLAQGSADPNPNAP